MPHRCCFEDGVSGELLARLTAYPKMQQALASLPPKMLGLASGKPPMGFVNPFFYLHAEAFFDVTQTRLGDQLRPFEGIFGYDGKGHWAGCGPHGGTLSAPSRAQLSALSEITNEVEELVSR